MRFVTILRASVLLTAIQTLSNGFVHMATKGINGSGGRKGFGGRREPYRPDREVGPLLEHICVPRDAPPRFRVISHKHCGDWLRHVQNDTAKEDFLAVASGVWSRSTFLLAAEERSVMFGAPSNVIAYFLVDYDATSSALILWAILSTSTQCSFDLDLHDEFKTYRELRNATTLYRAPHGGRGIFVDARPGARRRLA